MTREEAIEWINRIENKYIHGGDDDFDTKRKQALDMAIEALEADTVEVVQCKDCRHSNECHKSVQYTHNEPNTVTIGYSPIEWCSKGERSEK